MATGSEQNAAGKLLAASAPGEHLLGNAPTSVEIALGTEVAKRLADPRGLSLLVEGLTLLHPGAVYRVYLNLPPGQPGNPEGPYFLGSLSLYGGGLGDRSAPGSRSFDLSGKAQLLRSGAGVLRVTFERGNEPGASSREPAAFVRFTRVSLRQR